MRPLNQDGNKLWGIYIVHGEIKSKKLSVNLNGRDRLGDVGVSGRIILKLILQR
jgi:hypothetical protein